MKNNDKFFFRKEKVLLSVLLIVCFMFIVVASFVGAVKLLDGDIVILEEEKLGDLSNDTVVKDVDGTVYNVTSERKVVGFKEYTLINKTGSKLVCGFNSSTKLEDCDWVDVNERLLVKVPVYEVSVVKLEVDKFKINFVGKGAWVCKDSLVVMSDSNGFGKGRLSEFECDKFGVPIIRSGECASIIKLSDNSVSRVCNTEGAI